MSVTSVEKDYEALTLTLDAVDAPTSLEFTDGFSDADGRPAEDLPASTVRMTLTERDGGTRMELRSSFATREQMEQVMEMGAAEGIRQAVGQMDALLWSPESEIRGPRISDSRH